MTVENSEILDVTKRELEDTSPTWETAGGDEAIYAGKAFTMFGKAALLES